MSLVSTDTNKFNISVNEAAYRHKVTSTNKFKISIDEAAA